MFWYTSQYIAPNPTSGILTTTVSVCHGIGQSVLIAARLLFVQLVVFVLDIDSV